MAYVMGEDLDKRLARAPLTVGEALDIAIGVSKGLQEAHEKGVVHRDIKPGNIKITDKGPKVMDFGLAKLIDSPHLTKPGMTIGTAAYMSPEQTLGKPIDHRTDIWSMGVIADAGGCLHSNTEEVTGVLYRISRIKPNANMNRRFVVFDIMGDQFSLERNSAFQGIHHSGKRGQKAITRMFDHKAVIRFNRLSRHLIMDSQKFKCLAVAIS
jgi:serine/threonine protein kinase